MTLPDRLSIDERSPFYDAEALERGVGIIFNGKEREDVSEYCVSEGWIRVASRQVQGPLRPAADHQAEGQGAAFRRRNRAAGGLSRSSTRQSVQRLADDAGTPAGATRTIRRLRP